MVCAWMVTSLTTLYPCQCKTKDCFHSIIQVNLALRLWLCCKKLNGVYRQLCTRERCNCTCTIFYRTCSNSLYKLPFVLAESSGMFGSFVCSARCKIAGHSFSCQQSEIWRARRLMTSRSSILSPQEWSNSCMICVPLQLTTSHK